MYERMQETLKIELQDLNKSSKEKEILLKNFLILYASELCLFIGPITPTGAQGVCPSVHLSENTHHILTTNF